MSEGMTDRKQLSKGWMYGALGVMAVGFSLLIFMTVMAYKKAPPIPAKITDEAGLVLATGDQIAEGQGVFFKYGLMEHGTLWGHGAYLGPDYTASYLHREAEICREAESRSRFGKPFAELSPEEQTGVSGAVKKSLKENRYDVNSGVLVFTGGEAESLKTQEREWSDYFAKGAPGLPPGYVKHPEEIKALTAYLAWASWAASANRPGRTYSYTNNWPYEPIAGNGPSSQAYLWSALSLVFLLGGLGLMLFFFGKFNYLGWKGDEAETPAKMAPPAFSLTPSQRASGLYFLVVAALFLLQVLMGGALAHYKIEPNGFYGFDLAKYFPWTLLRTWHLQLAIFWIATSWVGGGLFLAPIIGGKEPKGQKYGVYALLGALAVVVFGSMAGEWLGLNDKLGSLWFWFGHQGSEYIDLGRFWQVLLAAGLVLWLILMFRALKPALSDPKKKEFSILFLLACAAIVVFYLPAFLWTAKTNFAVIDNWRFWIIHLWVEGFFELFATVLVAVMFTHMGLVSLRSATRVIYLDAILYLAGGLAGTAHHWYFTGEETVAMAIGACFSALEVVPLTLLTLDAWDFIKLQKAPCSECGEPLAHKQKWAIYFLMAVGFWNFVGAGIFGFLINLPIVSYFEMGTTLTPNHGHAAMFGVFGMLALAVSLYALRAMVSDEDWASIEKYFKTSFWGLNIGLALMIILNLFPAGVVQLYDVVQNGYAHARSLEFTQHGFFHESEWVRIIGDMTFILFGALPFAAGVVKLVTMRRKAPQSGHESA
ncbi:MAG: nitric-oxide reductase large subunit [Acidobacteria bacterium]|nr:nitric-oxide reductase large subunit [Acidobacteriota bacterium]